MVQVISKLAPINASCIEYVHPWTKSCMDASAGLYLYSIYDSLRIYSTVYTLALLMRGRIPRKEDLKRTFSGIMQSTAFLSATSLGYSVFLCFLRRALGHFNLLTVSAVPVFLSSAFAILIERPSRRPLLCLYVSNVATETVWNMLVYRKMVTPIPYGCTLIFGISTAMLMMYYKGGQHKSKDGKSSDSIFGLLRFVVGPYEENEYLQKRSKQMSEYKQANPGEQGSSRSDSIPQVIYPSSSKKSEKPSNKLFYIINQALRVYRRIIHQIKCYGRHLVCPHPFSCLYYTLQGSLKMFSTGLGIQVALKLVFNMRKIFTKPSSLKQIFFKKDLLALASFLTGFTGIFRAASCSLRWMTGKDDQYHALAAGLLAATAFTQYSDSTISLYVMWKALQITYNLGIDKGYLPRVPWFTEFLYCFSTAILFHAGIIEADNLRSSYYVFLHNISGGRISSMDRKPLDVWGCDTTEQLAITLKKTKVLPIVKHII